MKVLDLISRSWLLLQMLTEALATTLKFYDISGYIVIMAYRSCGRAVLPMD